MRAPEHITVAEMRILLGEAYAQDPEKTFLGQLARSLRDPAMPQDANNRLRLHPLWLMLGLLVLSVIGVFVVFSFLTP